ncbi:MAG TPA: KamA family radical SAM protein, partial [Spirochaetia bacterium]|nr:KamA family radical SAM protein [Spirochaetia bacterium]
RITEGLAALLAGYKPVWVVSQWNHPAELTDESLKAVSYLVDRGIPVLNQSVLLKGINDDLRTLGELFHGLVRMRVKPYYLFQGDLAKGTAHFRTNLRFGIALADELRGKISGLAMPAFAVDLPGGGGKVLLSSGSIQREENGFFVISGRDGKEYLYPNEPQ